MGRVNEMENTDYTRYAMESLLETQKIYHVMELQQMAEESAFIQESLKLGYMVLKESNDASLVAVTESITDAIVAFFEKIADMFRKKAVARNNKYGAWYKECSAQIKEKTANAATIELMPLWKGTWERDASSLIMAVNKAYDNYDRKRYDDYTFARDFLSNPDEVIKNGDNVRLKDELKNYFRYHVKGVEEPTTIKMTGAALVDVIDDMLKFNMEYNVGPTKKVDQIQTAIAKRLNQVNPPTGQTAAKESFTAGTWLSIEQRPVSESMLNTLANYSSLLEAEGDKKTESQTSSTADTTKIQVAGDNNDNTNNKQDATAANKAETTENETANVYWKNIERFFKTAVTAYQTAMDERYIQYNNVFLHVTQGSEFAPKFDKNGKYIPIDERGGNKTDATKVNQPAAKPKKTKKSFAERRQEIKAKK